MLDEKEVLFAKLEKYLVKLKELARTKLESTSLSALHIKLSVKSLYRHITVEYDKEPTGYF